LGIQAVVEVHNEKEALKVDVMKREKVSVD
jgi:hypothetical protein